MSSNLWNPPVSPSCRVLSLVEAPGASYFASLTDEEEQSISGTKSVVNNTSWMGMKQPWPRTLDHIHDVYGSGLSMRETGYVGYTPGTHIYIIYNIIMEVSWVMGVPPNHPFENFECSMKQTIQLLGYPHDYGNPHREVSWSFLKWGIPKSP